MPALITHDTFGQEVYADLYELIGGSRDDADAFLLGNQGPDPLFYTLLDPRLQIAHRLGSRMHREKSTMLLRAFKDSVTRLSVEDTAIGRAYVLGFLCHYELDSAAHPLIYSQIYALCDAGVPRLNRNDSREVHAVIESDLDEMILTVKRGTHLGAFNPSKAILKAGDHVLDVISCIYEQVARTVYGVIIPKTAYKQAVRMFRRVQAAFYSPSGFKHNVLGRIEQTVRPYSFYRAMSHRNRVHEQSKFDNHEGAVWMNPFTDEKSSDGFLTIYGRALKRAENDIALIDQNDFDMEVARIITRDVNFNGQPLNATIIAVEAVEFDDSAIN